LNIRETKYSKEEVENVRKVRNLYISFGEIKDTKLQRKSDGMNKEYIGRILARRPPEERPFGRILLK
jgi:hypothetical protein